MKKYLLIILASFMLLEYSGCGSDLDTNCGLWEDSRTSDQTFAASSSTGAKFAVIGDYGNNSSAEQQVADMVKAWAPDFIITTGDNNYPGGSDLTIDENVGQYYHEYIGNYNGVYGSGASSNKFFPSLGNHDWYPQAYINYFDLPGNERYYDFTWGPVHFFALSTVDCEPDGNGPHSVQAAWLQDKLSASDSPFKIVYGHHPAYSSGPHGSTPDMQWPFKEWGADAYIAGHDHIYERIMDGGFAYFTSGLGGKDIYSISPTPIINSVSRFNDTHGAMLVSITNTTAAFTFYAINGTMVDSYVVNK